MASTTLRGIARTLAESVRVFRKSFVSILLVALIVAAVTFALGQGLEALVPAEGAALTDGGEGVADTATGLLWSAIDSAISVIGTTILAVIVVRRVLDLNSGSGQGEWSSLGSALKSMPKAFAAGLLAHVIAFAPMLILLLPVLPIGALGGFGMVLAVFGIMWALIVSVCTVFTPHVVVTEGFDPLKAVRRGFALAADHVGSIFGYGLLSLLIGGGLVGLYVLGLSSTDLFQPVVVRILVGIVVLGVAQAVAALLMAHLYLRLRELHPGLTAP